MEIKSGVYAVGAVDSKIRMFHGYQTPIGTTYNSYLIVDEQITLIDFVKAPFAQTLLSNIRAVIGGRRIDHLICNHAEPDHSGALPDVLKAYPAAKVYGTANCQKALAAYYPEAEMDFQAVKAGETLHVGQNTLTFIPMPMVHWPDSMATYLAEQKILFSNDALGQHIGTGQVFDSELPLEALLDRAGDYYANIVLPFGMQVEKLLPQAAALDIEMVCPSHGVILTKYLPDMLEKYGAWCKNQTDPRKAVIVYDTMWGTTRKLACKLAGDCAGQGLEAELIDLSEKHHSYAMARLLEAKYIFVGSPTLNNGMLPSVAAFLAYMKGLKPKGRVGRAFGSYGWSGEAPGQINDILVSCGFDVQEPLKAMWSL